MSAYGNMDKAVAGLAYGQDTQYDSRVAGVEIAFSDAVFAPAGNSEIVNKTQTGELLGVAGRTQKDPGKYSVGDSVNIIRSGKVWVPVAGAVAAQAKAYLTPAGVWTDEVGTNLATNYIFREGTAGAGLALLEVIKKGAL